jgi:hypothetical protein
MAFTGRISGLENLTVRLACIPEHHSPKGGVGGLERRGNRRQGRGADVAGAGSRGGSRRAKVDLDILIRARGLGPAIPLGKVPVVRVAVVVHAAVVVIFRWNELNHHTSCKKH